jgi:hypothetical protein
LPPFQKTYSIYTIDRILTSSFFTIHLLHEAILSGFDRACRAGCYVLR